MPLSTDQGSRSPDHSHQEHFETKQSNSGKWSQRYTLSSLIRLFNKTATVCYDESCHGDRED